ncbi:TlpA family protein disulfide reductase [Rubrivirga sp.]|uniref:TlpA family protein disulfide reductase n=1 Tax=Rubrivirga sp. TaxID=1885344 RepID=UPI003C73DF5F
MRSPSAPLERLNDRVRVGALEVKGLGTIDARVFQDAVLYRLTDGLEVDSVAVDGSALWLRPSEQAVAVQRGFSGPNATFTDLEGASVSTSDLKGRTVVMVWWSTACTFCEEARPAINGTAARYLEDKSVVWLAPAGASDVEAEPNRSSIVSFLESRPYAPRVVLAPADALGAYAVGGYPRYTVLDAAGRIVFDESGSHVDRVAHLEAAIRQAQR